MKAFRILAGLFFLLCLTATTAFAQPIDIDNRTGCDFLVKVNMVNVGTCGPMGAGPLVPVPAGAFVNVGTPPPWRTSIAFGVEETAPVPTPPVVVGEPACGFAPVITGFGSCAARIEYRGHLLVIL